jgi:hypothetical protein
LAKTDVTEINQQVCAKAIPAFDKEEKVEDIEIVEGLWYAGGVGSIVSQWRWLVEQGVLHAPLSG